MHININLQFVLQLELLAWLLFNTLKAPLKDLGSFHLPWQSFSIHNAIHRVDTTHYECVPLASAFQLYCSH